MEQSKASEFRHGEAYCLMWYACSCGHREQVWNSRDGVTPFGLACPSCGKSTLMHVEWNRDHRAQGYRANRGQRFFRDGTAADAVEIIERRIKSAAEKGYDMPAVVAAELRKDALQQTGEWQAGWPFIERVP